MSDKAIITGTVALPLHLINAQAVKAQTTYSYFEMGSEVASEVAAWREEAGYLHVPRQFGLTYCHIHGIETEDQTSRGEPISYRSVATPRDYQEKPLEDLQAQFGSYFDFIFRARTGFGKSLTSMILSARLGVTTLIVVDQDNLKSQWVKEIVRHFGVEEKDIGSVQGKVCKYQGCAVTIAMVQTLSQRRYPDEFYRYFGLVVFDEVHVFGAPTFSTVLQDFPATYRLGVSATPRRRDGAQKALEHNLGKVRVYVADAHAASSLLVAENVTTYSWYANTSAKTGRYLAEVTEDGARNLLIAESALMLYESGRDFLVLSDRIEQLHHLMALCYFLGIPAEEMGVHAGDSYSYRYVKQATPPRRPKDWERGTEYTPVELKLISKKVKKDRLEEIKASARGIFATYGMFSKGVDLPRLAGGVDASPRSQSEQMHGRILRVAPGKLDPIWVTIVDVNSYRSVHQLAERLSGYRKNAAEMFYLRDDWSTEPCDIDKELSILREKVRDLKRQDIRQLYHGVHVVEPKIQGLRVRAPAPDTKTTTPRPSVAPTYTRRVPRAK